MKSKREQILELCEFDEADVINHSKPHSFRTGPAWEYSIEDVRRHCEMKKPIIQALLSRLESLEGALKKSLRAIFELSCESSTSEMTRDELVILECHITKKAFKTYNDLRQALATSPLDEILNNNKGEKDETK